MHPLAAFFATRERQIRSSSRRKTMVFWRIDNDFSFNLLKYLHKNNNLSRKNKAAMGNQGKNEVGSMERRKQSVDYIR